MSTVRDEIAKNLLYYRKRAGMTQKQLAEKLGVKNTAVSNWESGNNSIDIDTLFAACDVFGVTINDMYGQSSTKEQSLSDDELRLLSMYRELNSQGKDYILQTITMASQVYTKNDSVSYVEISAG